MFLRKKHMLYFLLLFYLLLLTACGNKNASGNQPVKEEEAEEETEQDTESGSLYVVLGINSKKKLITFKNLNTNRQEEYTYTGGTYILDKYDNNLILTQIMLGEVVDIELTSGSDKLKKIQVSDQVFSYNDISEYTFDETNNKLKIGKTDYYFDKDLTVFSNDQEIAISELGSYDVLSIRGQDKRVLSIVVTLGHGTIVLENTQLYEGGYVTIGKILSQVISKDMRIEVPEGTHLLTASNDGYSGYIEITVNRDDELTINLEELEQEVPKTCVLKFNVSPENAVVKVDGEIIDISSPMTIRYGTYKVQVTAEGYQTLEKNVKVSSSEATVKITLQEEKDETEETEETPAQGTSV